jgi:hypothetical protein
MYILYVQNKKYAYGLMMSIPLLYKIIASHKIEGESKIVFCDNKPSDVIVK